MSAASQQPIKWSTQFFILPAQNTPPLRGDKIILPPSALEQLLSAATVTASSAAQPQTSSFDAFNPYSFAAEQQAREQLLERRQELPHPLTFRLVNPSNGRICYAGIREFSAVEGYVGLSDFLRYSLGFEEKSTSAKPNNLSNEDVGHEVLPDPLHEKVTIHIEALPKGTYVRLRPLEAGYDPEDWKSLLEKHLRDNFTTLTNGEILSVVSGREEFRFLVDGLKPNDRAVSLVDTDLEVDIEALNEEQARETLKKRVEKAKRAPGIAEGTSPGGAIEVGQDVLGQVRPGEYVDYTIDEWNNNQDLEIDLSPQDNEQDIDLFATPAGPTQAARPREIEHVFADFSSGASKRIKINHTNAELDNAKALWVSVRGYEHNDSISHQPNLPIQYHLRVASIPSSTSTQEQPSSPQTTQPPNPDEELCSNCHQPVPKRTMFLHQNFCLRNNIFCPACHQVFQKTSSEWANHWHCPHDSSHGNTPSSHTKHDTLHHTPRTCPACNEPCRNVPDLAHHRTTICPAKPILCRFCHLLVPQRGPDDPEMNDPEVLLSGLTPHEVVDGSRTTECHLCSRIVRLRDMPTHLKHHDYERLSRPSPVLCRNRCCGRTVVGYTKDGKRVARDGGETNNELGMCNTCFGPLYANTYDPEGKQLRRRMERRYLSQFLTGCGKEWCRNEYCKSGRKNMGLEAVEGSKEAGARIRELLDKGLVSFCTDEGSQRRREVGEMVAAERGEGDGVVVGKVRGEEGLGEGKEEGVKGGGYEVEWCVNALEVEGGDLLKARGWLKDWAPTREESRM
ncbi:MAG: hypothetical protein LQ338_007909 [Usnochroma carphineum]|nr:MAG: hypothetical protein LQ338_007909 [Usnochroma carphineum]